MLVVELKIFKKKKTWSASGLMAAEEGVGTSNTRRRTSMSTGVIVPNTRSTYLFIRDLVIVPPYSCFTIHRL